jgi:YVTN family beta-propeller protein
MARIERQRIIVPALIASLIVMTGCQSTPPPGGGFTISTNERYASGDNPPVLGPRMRLANIPVKGNLDHVPANTQTYGNVQAYWAETNYIGLLDVDNAVTPGYWDQYVTFGFPCGGLDLYSVSPDGWTYLSADVLMAQNELYDQDCLIYSLPEASTRFAIVGQFPQNLTLYSQSPLSTEYGMPVLAVFDQTGASIASATASNISSDGTQASFPFPSALPAKAYTLAISNETATGQQGVGANLLSIAQSTAIGGNPFGVAVSGQTNGWSDRNTCTRTNTNGSTYSTFPVVSLYSSNQVLVNGTPIGVGANPTAVAVFPAAPVRTSSGNGCDNYQNSFSGTTQAIVANSGGNTVTVLDIVNNAALSTITVGSQPVALVVTPDGSTAYVANYTDSTVTEVNLNTDTPVTTVAVGGHPTSIALAAPSTLWVGGLGFLSQVNAQNMTVAATESTSGKTIAALGFSDAENELIATAVDASGNVSIDEISPSSVYPGSAYATTASHQVSTVGTYTNPYTHAQVQAFTATIGQTSVPISSNLPGAPPLVVQDGWAIVSATPTGFNITDASGHLVLVSETTPSPIAAIAVDTNLNVAYLTMPDSNTLLTVPLPGVGNPADGTAPGFTITATNNNPAQTALSLGHSMSYTINVSPVNGFAGAVSLWVDGLPAGVSASFSPDSIATSGNATLTLAAAYSASTEVGTSTAMVTGTGGGISTSVAIPLTVQPLQYKGYCSVH